MDLYSLYEPRSCHQRPGPIVGGSIKEVEGTPPMPPVGSVLHFIVLDPKGLSVPGHRRGLVPSSHPVILAVHPLELRMN